MESADLQIKPRRRGRPPNGPLERLKAKMWSFEVADRLAVNTGYGMEKHFAPEKIRRGPYGGTIRTCKYDKHKRGDHVPDEKLVDDVEVELPGTKYFIEHPFWTIAKTPIAGIEEFYIQLGNLRPEIANLLFYYPIKKGRMPIRRITGPFGVIDDLMKESDWDALTACIGLIQEVNYRDPNSQFYLEHYSKRTLGVFLPFISQPPFSMLAHELFQYIREHFLERPEDPIWTQKLNSIDLDRFIYTYQLMLKLIDDLGILRHYPSAPPSCLYLAERYLKPPVIEEVDALICHGYREEAKKLRAIKSLTRRLRKWETKIVKNKTTTTM